MKKYYLILYALVFLLSCGEDEEKPKLPPISTYGANTLGFEIDGIIWTPCCVDNSIFGV